MENKTVIAVVVTYNRKELLKESIEALINSEKIEGIGNKTSITC